MGLKQEQNWEDGQSSESILKMRLQIMLEDGPLGWIRRRRALTSKGRSA